MQLGVVFPQIDIGADPIAVRDYAQAAEALGYTHILAFDRVVDAGINPLPVQRPIPIWIGGSAEAVIRRVGRLADGWLPQFPSLDPGLTGADAHIDAIRRYKDAVDGA